MPNIARFRGNVRSRRSGSIGLIVGRNYLGKKRYAFLYLSRNTPRIFAVRTMLAQKGRVAVLKLFVEHGENHDSSSRFSSDSISAIDGNADLNSTG